MRANKGVTFPNTCKATPRAILGCVPGINFSDSSLSLNLVVDHVKDHATRPNGEPSIPCLATLLALLKIQVLEHKNAVLRSPFDELLRCTMTEIFGSTRSLNSKPFEGSNNASSIPSLCLMLSKLSLKSLDRLRSAPVLDFPIQAAYEKLISIRINCHDRISLVKINTYRMNPFNFRKFNRVGNIADKLVTKIFDYDAINLSGIAEVFLECFRNTILKVLPAIDGRNAQEVIFRETGISPPLSDKEQSKRSMPVERMLQLMTILLGRSISSGSQPNTCAGKLTGNVAFDIIINSAMQIQSFQRFALVPGSLGYVVAYLSKAIEGLDERFVALDNYLQGSLGKHQLGDTTMMINTLRFSGGD
jgi:hypothetical protein